MKSEKPVIPGLARWLLERLDRYELKYNMSLDLEEEYYDVCSRKGRAGARLWYWLQVFYVLLYYFVHNSKWRLIMIKNYLRIAVRSIVKQKGFSIINISGLALGLTACLLIFLFVKSELSYDRYHPDADRCYRIVLDIQTPTSNRVFAAVGAPAGPTLKKNFPQVESAARILPTGPRLINVGTRSFYEEDFMWADPEVFDIFHIPFLYGDEKSALNRPLTVVITKKIAEKYFGKKQALGKTIKINHRNHEVTGVVTDSPVNTHLKYSFIASFSTLAQWSEIQNWYATMVYTYFKVSPNVDMEQFAAQASRLADPYVKERLDQSGTTYHYMLQALPDIHLHSHLRYEIEPGGNPIYITIFSLVGIFILVIACINFMNLSTARSAIRSREVGLRKVVGAQRRQLVAQFLGESYVMTFLALLLALLITWLVLPLVQRYYSFSINFTQLLQPGFLLLLLFLVLFTGLLAGAYPAFFLASFRPALTLQSGHKSGSRGAMFRKILTVGQFSISIMLIIGTLTVYRQLNFMKNFQLGFEKEQKLVLPIRGGISIERNYIQFKERFLGLNSVSDVSVSSTVPGRGESSFSVRLVGEMNEMKQDMYHIYFDDRFIKQYGIEMVAGRPFDKNLTTDIKGAFIINEAGVKAFGWSSAEEALGKRIQTGFGGRVIPVIGVTKNFHYRGLQNSIDPLLMEFHPGMFDMLSMTVATDNLPGTLSAVESTWKKMYPNNPFEFFFLDSDFNRQYQTEERLGKIFGFFTMMGLFIACLGLFGVALFVVQQRLKEIGVRKVLGASVPDIVRRLSFEFSKWVLLANVIAWPVGYFLMKDWLDRFAYRTQLGFFVFLLAGLSALAIALVTVTYQAVKAAMTNPVDVLKYE